MRSRRRSGHGRGQTRLLKDYLSLPDLSNLSSPRFGMAAPLLVQMEDDIDREIEKERLALESSQNGDTTHWIDQQAMEESQRTPNLIYGPQPQVVTNDLLSLDEMVSKEEIFFTCKKSLF